MIMLNTNRSVESNVDGNVYGDGRRSSEQLSGLTRNRLRYFSEIGWDILQNVYLYNLVYRSIVRNVYDDVYGGVFSNVYGNGAG